MMNYQKIFASLVMIGIGIILVVFLWQKPLILSLVLTFVAFLKHRFLPIKKEFLFFVVAGFLGAVTESLVMLAGPWSYARPHLVNFPFWLPFLWGLAGTIGITLYEGLN